VNDVIAQRSFELNCTTRKLNYCSSTYLAVELDRGFSFELMPREVCVVRGRYEIMGQALLHVSVRGHHLLGDEGVVFLVHEVPGEALERHAALQPQHGVGLVSEDEQLYLFVRLRLHLFGGEKLGEVGGGQHLTHARVHAGAVVHNAGGCDGVKDFLLVSGQVVLQILRAVSSQET
jgi:hypothetical protein